MTIKGTNLFGGGTQIQSLRLASVPVYNILF